MGLKSNIFGRENSRRSVNLAKSRKRNNRGSKIPNDNYYERKTTGEQND
jgi:hypothetical protein